MRGVEAFSIGEKRGKKYTPQDLEDIVRNFREFGKGQRPGFDVPVVRGREDRWTRALPGPAKRLAGTGRRPAQGEVWGGQRRVIRPAAGGDPGSGSDVAAVSRAGRRDSPGQEPEAAADADSAQ